MSKLRNSRSTVKNKTGAQKRAGGELTIALAGNANVGKSVIFNQLTGANQIIGNWPGKTVERAEGRLSFEGYDIKVIDLPGIYSFSTYSLEETISRDYIAQEKPDVVINVVDASVLERNLFFTLQLKEMEVPLVICLNQMDVARSKSILVDAKKLEAALGVPVVPTVAVRGIGLTDLIRKALEVTQQKQKTPEIAVRYGAEVEMRLEKLTRLIKAEQIEVPYPARWVALKLLENDPEIRSLVAAKSGRVIELAGSLAEELQHIHEEPAYAVIISERYSLANRIAGEVQRQDTPKVTFSEKLDRIVTHKVYGYITSVAVIVGLLLWTFTVGNYLSGILSNALSFFESVNPELSGPLWGIIWNGVFGGIVAGVTLIIPFVIPFYIMLAMMEDSGILTRIAFMMDTAMHKIGLHGKAIIPLILGYGCNVPAIAGTRIMETKRERLLSSFAITFTSCAARTIVILGLVAVFVSIPWALGLYGVDILVMFVAARIALRIMPGKMSGLIMEMHLFKVPSFSVVLRQTWSRTKSIIYMVFPVYVIGSALVQVLYVTGALEPINSALAFLTVGWLGLPVFTGILLIFGVVRKELILLALIAIYGTDLTQVLTPVQLIVLATIGMLYIPCLATILVLAKEFGWKAATAITLANLGSAFIMGGVMSRVLRFIF